MRLLRRERYQGAKLYSRSMFPKFKLNSLDKTLVTPAVWIRYRWIRSLIYAIFYFPEDYNLLFARGSINRAFTLKSERGQINDVTFCHCETTRRTTSFPLLKDIRRGKGWSASLATWSPPADSRAGCWGEPQWRPDGAPGGGPPWESWGRVWGRRETSARWRSVAPGSSPLTWSRRRRNTCLRSTIVAFPRLKKKKNDDYQCLRWTTTQRCCRASWLNVN